MSETVTLSKADLDALLAKAAAGNTPAAQLASPPTTEPEPPFTIGDALRTLVHYARLPQEELQRKCLAAIDEAYPVENPAPAETGEHV